MHYMQDDIQRVVIAERAIKERVVEMAGEIADAYGPCTDGITIVTVLAGSLIFLSDLIRLLPIKMRVGLVAVSSYAGRTTASRGATTLGLGSLGDLRDRNVLIVDDIVETGRTLRIVQAEVRRLEPRSVQTAVLLRKMSRAPADVPVDYIGFDIEDVFVVGYGLDYDGLYRNLPYIAVLRPELYDTEA